MGRRPSTVAFQGEKGAFSHIAAQKLAGTSARTVACESFREVFEQLVTGGASQAVIPIENTLHGSIHENYDNLLEYDIPIRGETSVRISHQLIARPGTRFAEVRDVFSHPVALNQCRRFFVTHPGITPKSFYDTAGSVKMLMEQQLVNAGAVASKAAAEIYGGVILKGDIEDNPRNFTRFFLLSKQPARTLDRNRPWKTSLVFTTPNKPGALFRAMACFALRDIDLMKIESRPLIGQPWEYLFYLDVAGRDTDTTVENAIRHLAEASSFCKILGSYQTTQ